MRIVPFMQRALPLNAVGDALGGVCLRSAAAEGEENEADVDGLEEETNHAAAGERFGVISSERFLSTVHLVRANGAVHLFSRELAWRCHRVYSSWFFQESGFRRKGFMTKTTFIELRWDV